MRRVQSGITIRRPKKKRNIQNDARIKACIERHVAGAYTPHISFCERSATVSAHIRQRSTSCWTTVTLMTTTSSSNHNRINNHRRNRMTALGHQRRSSTTHSLPTPAKCASSLHVLALPSCHAAILDSAPVAQRRLWRQWTAAVPYAVVLSQWCCVSSVSLTDCSNRY